MFQTSVLKTVCSSREPIDSKHFTISSILLNPWLDRAAAVFIAVYAAYLIAGHPGQLTLSYALFLTAQLQLIGIMLFRRKAERIETNPWVLALSLLRLFWLPLFFKLADASGAELLTHTTTNVISCVLFALIIFARMSLGRSLGCFPAERKIVDHGAYRFVRHPIQAVEILFCFNFLLSCFTWKTALVTIFGALVYLLKSLAEERFLAQSEAYQNYRSRVRWRFFPYLF